MKFTIERKLTKKSKVDLGFVLEETGEARASAPSESGKRNV